MPGGNRERAKAAVLQHLASGMQVRTIAAKTNVSEHTIWRWLQDEDFRQKLDELQSQALEGVAAALAAASTEAVATLRALLSSKVPMARLGSARAILEMLIKLREIAGLEERLRALEDGLPGRQSWPA